VRRDEEAAHFRSQAGHKGFFFFFLFSLLSLVLTASLMQRPDYAVVECSTSQPLEFEVTQIMPNENGSMICLVGKHGAAILRLNRRTRAELSRSREESETTSVVVCKTTHLSPLFFGLHPNISILQGKKIRKKKTRFRFDFLFVRS
jgi:hypothetical protein